LSRTCGMYGEAKYMQYFGAESEGKRTLKCEDNINSLVVFNTT